MIALLRAVAGLIVWALAFSAIYGLQGLVCGLRWQAVALGPLSLGRALLILLWLAFVALLSWMNWRFWPRRKDSGLLSRLAAATALIGLVATAYTGLPVVSTSVCQ